MRLEIALSPLTEKPVIDLNHSYHLASLIYRSIGRSDSSLSLELHRPNTFKFFTFSRLMVPGKRFRITGDKMVVESKEIHFFFSTLRDEIAVKLVEGLLEKPEVKVGEAEFVVSEIRVMEEKEVGEKEKFVTLSPVNVTTAEHSNGKNRIIDLYPDNPRFYENIRRNLIKKYVAFYGKEPSDARMELTVLKSKPKRIRVKNTFHRCVEMVFVAEGSKELMEVGYKAGWGERNSMGFGMVKVV